MKQFPRTRLYLSILREELISLEKRSARPGAGDAIGMTELRRLEMTEQSIAEIEFLLELGEQQPESSPWALGWSPSQLWLVLLVMVASALLMGAGLWASLILR